METNIKGGFCYADTDSIKYEITHINEFYPRIFKENVLYFNFGRCNGKTLYSKKILNEIIKQKNLKPIDKPTGKELFLLIVKTINGIKYYGCYDVKYDIETDFNNFVSSVVNMKLSSENDFKRWLNSIYGRKEIQKNER